MSEESIAARISFQGNDGVPAKLKMAIVSNTGNPRFLLRLTQGAEAHVRHRGEVLNAIGLDAERAYPDLLCGLVTTTLFAEKCGHRGSPWCSLGAGVKQLVVSRRFLIRLTGSHQGRLRGADR